MFCFQCQETLKNEACVKVGVCGKSDEVAGLQDLLVWTLKGLSYYGVRARQQGIVDAEADLFVAEALFATITNVNFDPQRIGGLIERSLTLRERLRGRLEAAQHTHDRAPADETAPPMARWTPGASGADELLRQAARVGIQESHGGDPDLRSLRELVIYGLKGLAAYADHAYVLEQRSPELLAFLQEGLWATANPAVGPAELVALALRCGEVGVAAMALLDGANTSAFGHPEPTWVDLGVRPGPAILVSGHDLRDLAELLEQTAGTGVNVYTHGEMLPAHAYPGLKRYPHLVGNYGGAWWDQQRDFTTFRGAILMTTNCLVKPTSAYRDRIFTTGMVGWPGLPHIAGRAPGRPKDFSALIERARQLGEPEEIERGRIPVGFAHAAALRQADAIVEAVRGGAIKRFVVMAGCDGRQASRSYYTQLAEQLPHDMVILTAGCAKYRYNKLNLGDINGIPRVLDAGQCNDSYSLVVVAQKLAEVFGLEDINDLPISYDIAWYEQKAVLVLLSLLYLGVKHIRLGPTLPAFLSPNVVDVLVDRFDLKPVADVEADLAAIVAGR